MSIDFNDLLSVTFQGEAILFAPKRGTTFDAFINLAKSHFEVTITQNYDEDIWQKHLVCLFLVHRGSQLGEGPLRVSSTEHRPDKKV